MSSEIPVIRPLSSGWLAGACAFFVAFGALLVRSTSATPAVTWMFIYRLTDFQSVPAIVVFIRRVRIPIPIVIGLSEIFDNYFFGDSWLVDVLLYRIALVGAFLLAIMLSPRTVTGLATSLFSSAVFLWGAVVIHPGNPQVYDILYPFFLLGFILMIERVRCGVARGRMQVMQSFAAGLLLSMTELSRPFVLFLLPVLLLMAFLNLRGAPRRAHIFFLLPLLLVSGGWHLYIGIAHGELTWTNHSGFNLQRSWPRVSVPALLPETNSAPLGAGRWANLDTPEHQENSRRLETAIVGYALDHPVGMLSGLGRRALLILAAPTSIYGHHPSHPILWLYRPLVWLASFALLLRLARCARIAYTRPLQIVEEPAGQAAAAALLSILLLATGEAGEQARFLLSVLPLLALVLAAEADQSLAFIAGLHRREMQDYR